SAVFPSNLKGVCMDLFRRGLAHADAVGDADALVGVAGEVQAGNRGRTRFDLPDPVEMADGVLGHGARPAEDAREARVRSDSGDLTELARDLADYRFVGFVQRLGIVGAANEAARHDCAFRDTVRELGADPGAGYETAPLLLGNEKTE